MRLLVLGEHGQVATELARRAPAGWEVITAGRNAADFTDPNACARLVTEVAVDAIINAAAYTAVDQAETEERIATIINAETPTTLAQIAARRDLPFLHISTDYVFNGTGSQPWKPDDPTAPLSAYGRSKLKGEEGIRAANCSHVILRTSWVFSAHGKNFLKTMLRLSETRDKLTIVSDQYGGPTPASAIADALLNIAPQIKERPETSGTYHFSGAPDTTWADFARDIFRQAGRVTKVEDIPTSAYPTPAHRPENSRMDCDSLYKEFNIERPDWRKALTHILNELGACT